MPDSVSQTRALPHATLATDVRIAVNRLSRRLRSQKADPTITDAQFSALALLHRDGPLTLAELSAAEGITAPSMTKTVTALMERKLVDKSPSADDGRKIALTTTPTGSSFVLETRRRRDSWLTPRLTRLTPEERRILAEATTIMRSLAQQ